MRNAFFLYLLLFCPALACARDYPMLHYTQQDGLPSDQVYSIFQDPADGMIWFATDKGISRYNGLQFEHFTTNDGLPDNDIFFFRKDYEGRLWIATYNGELCFYKNGLFHTAKNTPFLRAAGKNTLTSNLTVQPDSSITVFFSDSRRILVIRGEEVRSIPLPLTGKPVPSALAEVRIQHDTIIVSYDHYRLVMDRQGKLLYRYPEPYIKPDLSSDYYSLRSDQDKDGLFSGNLYDRAGKKIWNMPDSFSSVNRVNKFYRTKNHFFACTNYGLWIDSLLILKGQKVSGIIQDLQGNYWVSTLSKGVFKLPRHFLAATRLMNVYQSVVTHVLGEGKNIVFGTEDMCLYRISGTNVPCFFNFRETFHKPVKAPAYALFSFVPEEYYVFTSYHNFKINSRYNREPVSLHSLQYMAIKSFLLKNTQELYIHSTSRIQLTEPGKLSVADYAGRLLSGSDTIAKKYQLRMAPDSSIWYTDVNSVYRIINGMARKQQQFGALTFREMMFCKGYLVGVNPFNRLILAHDYNGDRIHIDSSIDNDCVWDRFYKLTDSSLLITTNDYYRVLTFGADNGYRISVLEYPFIPQLAEKVYSDGDRCWFFKNGSVTALPVADLVQPPGLPHLKFTAVRASGRTMVPDTFLELSYNHSRDLSLYYSARSFNTTDISFEYSINEEGQPEHWIKSNGTNIDLFNIASGVYTIRIRAVTFGKRYSEAPGLQIRIGLPFWLSWWFFSLIVLITGVSVFLCVRFFTRRRIRQKERENKFLRSEFTALNALMNPHFVFNSLNSVQSLINKEDLESANQYVRTISDLLRQNMHNISRELISLKKELELIENYLKLEKLRFKDRLQYTISIAEDVEEEFVLIPPLLIQPLVENAIKYTMAFSEISSGHIRIDTYTEGALTIINVTDNGKGLTQNRKEPGHESTALENIRKRLVQLSQIHKKIYLMTLTELKDEAGNVTGTQVRISIEL